MRPKTPTMTPTRTFLLVALLAFMVATYAAGEPDHTYADNEEVKVFADKMGPRSNPYETYAYDEAPGCELFTSEKALTLGELLAGDHNSRLQTNIHFNKDIVSSVLCTFRPTKLNVEMLKGYISRDYYYELTVDDLPVWGAIGAKDPAKDEYRLFLHRVFHIGVNKNQIVNVTLETSLLVPLKESESYSFTYAVKFEPSWVQYKDRLSTVLETRYAGTRTRIVSVINSLVIVFFLLCVITLIITRTLRSEYAKMEQEPQMRFDGQDIIDESGWRCLSADVFRVPRHTSIFCAILGSGAQLLVLMAVGIALSVVSNYQISMNHNLVTYSVVGYMLTSGVTGYVSGYQFMGCGLLAPPMASKWIWAFHAAFMLIPLTYAIAFVPSSFIALIYGSAQLPYVKGTIFVLAMWGIIAYPLCLVGVLCSRYVFRRTERRRNIPHVNQIPRLIPRAPRKLLSPRALLLGSGALPFMAIFVEFSFVFTCLWSYKVFHLYGFLTITTVLFIAVVSCTSVVATFLLLTTENHHWKWLSMGFGASCSLYAFAYALYFYFFKTAMHGFFMLVVYFSYCVTFALFLAIVGGTVGYFSASYFVKKIYSQAKHD